MHAIIPPSLEVDGASDDDDLCDGDAGCTK